MKVLDLDLDYFLKALCPLADEGTRPFSVGCESEAFVRQFLERDIGLTKPVPGRVFETHDRALVFWEEMIRDGRLAAPFDAVRADAHSDLGIGYPGPNYVLYNVLARDPEKRRDLASHYTTGQLDEANYMIFALAMRRISGIVNLRRPFSVPDVPRAIDRGDYLKLPEPFPEILGMKYGEEPRVPFREEREEGAYRDDGAFDFVTLAMSPRYAPEEADALSDIIREYITEI